MLYLEYPPNLFKNRFISLSSENCPEIASLTSQSWTSAIQAYRLLGQCYEAEHARPVTPVAPSVSRWVQKKPCDFTYDLNPARGIGRRKEYILYFMWSPPLYISWYYIYIYYRYIFLHSIWQTSSRTFYLTYHTGHSICRCTWHHTRHSIWYSDIQYYFTSSLTSYLTLCLASYPTLSRIFWPTNIFSASLTFDILCDAVPGIILDIFFDIFWHTIWHLLWHSIWRCAWHHTWHSIVRPQTVWQNVHKWI